ncbi:helix-turn-helix transcriptional regulator [Jannaschia seohaensis]|uniref:Regulatory LuxR family protein n=1 Tax=Jannaschia seohaensis TaxID=475081 RepID=A0A2Y9AYS3_9RHOB|nr:LuxR C-terminal-related transcriptional regulator [Jannaschia seohaensis]PWJ16228.1 regulatory LuxR family protein [Jannaschia seohaensis]SSA49286.1 regulatory protein, luxR family [Jannaschia seohaensis]
MKGQAAIAGIVAVQAACALMVVSDTVVSVLGLRATPLDWQLRELLEVGAALGLVLGTVMGVVALRRSDARRRKVEDQLRIASGAFSALMEQRFAEWGLTPAERDVALFSIKGLTLSDMAATRGTSEGTIKAQTAAVYRKAGVTSRTQLVCLFIEDLMGEPLVPLPKKAGDAVEAHRVETLPLDGAGVR